MRIKVLIQAIECDYEVTIELLLMPENGGAAFEYNGTK